MKREMATATRVMVTRVAGKLQKTWAIATAMTNNKSMCAMMRATMKMARAARAMVTTMRVQSNKEIVSAKGHGIGHKDGVQQRG